MLEAGKYYLRKQQRSIGVSEAELIRIAVKSMGLDELAPFDPQKKIIEYRLRGDRDKQLVGMSVARFVEETASESAAPGGGSIAACCGAMGAALGTMVANLSSHKKGWDARWEEFSEYAAQGQAMVKELLELIDKDTEAFNGIMAALGMPKGNEQEKAARKAALDAATLEAIRIPFRTMQVAAAVFPLVKAMAEIGNPNSVSDAGVGALCARTAIKGAYLNVRINAQSMAGHPEVAEMVAQAEALNREADVLEQEAWAVVMGKIK
jgi:glutamate formiminotransferase/formiminotetrahydrofolate cyclodeaminase